MTGPDRASDVLLDALADRLADRLLPRLIAALDTPVERHAYTLEEAADALSVSVRHLHRLIKDGVIATTMLGARRVIPAVEVRRLAVEGLAHDTEVPVP